MIMCVLLCYPVSIHMLQLLSTGRPISSLEYLYRICFFTYFLMFCIMVKFQRCSNSYFDSSPWNNHL